MKYLVAAILSLVAASLACNTGGPDRSKLNLYPSPTSEATQTPIVVEVTTSPMPPIYVVITSTPVLPTATNTTVQLCASATKAVNLRPSASDDGYPIAQLKNGEQVTDLGGRQGDWLYVSVGKYQGWIHKRYLGQCK